MARWRKLGIIAGAGPLPHRVAEACRKRGEAIHVVRLAGMAGPELDEFAGEAAGIAEAGKIIRSLKEGGCDAVILAGVVKRPDFKSLRPDWRGAALIPKLAAAATRGDGAILSALIETLEGEGFIVAGVDEAMCELLAAQGPLGRLAPDLKDLADIAKGAAIVRALGPFDVGQGAVVAGGHVLAVEAAEGTDAMLDRCAALPASARGGERNGVLVKRPKPRQELRVDLPTIGVETVR
ncbi:MAG: UDP-2,3-diacylglucosamine diphosphatase LpxI, partial [Parvularculaceae bacterium]